MKIFGEPYRTALDCPRALTTWAFPNERAIRRDTDVVIRKQACEKVLPVSDAMALLASAFAGGVWACGSITVSCASITVVITKV